MNLEEEKQLLQQIQKDPEKFGVIFDAWYKPIFNYIVRRVADYDISKDIAAECFLKAFLNIQSFTWKGISLSSWLYRIATNEINYYYRQNKKYITSLNQLLQDGGTDVTDQSEYLNEKQLLEKELERHNEYKRVQQSLIQLDIKYQEVLSLRYFEKKSILEMADILNKNEGTIKSLLSRGTAKLRKLLMDAT